MSITKEQLRQVITANKRNNHSPKRLKSQYGEFHIAMLRDRNGGKNILMPSATGKIPAPPKLPSPASFNYFCLERNI